MAPKPDKYLLANGTLKNLLGITNADELQQLEHLLVSRRIAKLKLNQFALSSQLTLAGNSFDEVIALHRYLFADIYDWAGQFRTVDMAKETVVDDVVSQTNFLPAQFLLTAREQVQADIHQVHQVNATEQTSLAESLAQLLVDLNYMHPFREGNGRTQRTYVVAVAFTKGYQLRFNLGDYQRYMLASMHDDARLMAAVLADSMNLIQ